MAKPFKEGTSWSIRVRRDGRDYYATGFATSAAAKKAERAHLDGLALHGKPAGLGPARTTVAQALQDAAIERLPFLRGAPQEANRINRYLRAAGIATLVAAPTPSPEDATMATAARGRQRLNAAKVVHYEISLRPLGSEQPIVNSLKRHRKALQTKSARSDKLRACLACTPVADVTRKQIADLVGTLAREGYEPATLEQERSLLRVVFNHARVAWGWTQPGDNPATALRMPSINNGRTRVLTAEEQIRLEEALDSCRNDLIRPVFTLLIETAMRTSEPLQHARWGDVDWERRVLRLGTSKTGGREVPLSPTAIETLLELRGNRARNANDPLVELTYEQLKAAWMRACERAGIEHVRLHDLRHTAATRCALKYGNVFLVQALTGHKSLSQVQRYVNVSADDLVRRMHGTAESERATPTLTAPKGNVPTHEAGQEDPVQQPSDPLAEKSSARQPESTDDRKEATQTSAAAAAVREQEQAGETGRVIAVDFRARRLA